MAKKKTKAPAQPKPTAKPEMGDGGVSEDGPFAPPAEEGTP